MMTNTPDLHEQFAQPGLRFEPGNGGLLRAVIETENCRGEMYLHGAHVSGFTPANHEPVLWMSEKSLFESAKPIRGGVPICFPWFGPHPSDASAPAHGLARTHTWELKATEQTEQHVQLTIQARIENYGCEYAVSFGKTLDMQLQVTLSETATEPATFEAALHTYLVVGDAREIFINGLESTGFLDKVDGGKMKSPENQPIRFTGQCDRVYNDTTDTVTLHDRKLGRRIVVSKSNSTSTVVWNPWIEKSAAMPDFGDDEWPRMVCIETANVGAGSISLRPGQSQHMVATIEVSKS